MAKSEGNTRLVHDLLQDYDGETLRLALLSAQYSQPLDWTENLLQQTRKTLDRLYQALREISDVPQEKDSDQLDNPVLEALCDDLNTPKAIAALGQLSKTAAQTKSPADKAALSVGANLLGVLQKNADEWLGYGQESSEVDAVKIENLLQQRQDARKEKNFARADEIRKELTDMGIAIEDTAQGPVWKKI